MASLSSRHGMPLRGRNFGFTTQTMQAQIRAESRILSRLPAWAKQLLAPRNVDSEIRRNPIRLAEVVVFALYAAVLAFAIPHHLGSDDEAQAWLLARDNPLRTLLFYRMHYEGAPGLWPILLRCAVLLHLPYASIHWIAACFALLGVALLLRYAPLPRLIRWLLPFTFFMQYQYAVIARPYVLFAPLLFGLCILFTLKHPRPILFALVAGLIANISLHAAMLAGFFSLVYLHRLYAERFQPRLKPARRQTAAALLVFTLLAAFSAIVAFPAPDVATDGYAGDTSGTSHPFLRRLIPTQHLPPTAPPLDLFLPPDFKDPSSPQTAVPPPPEIVGLVFRTFILAVDTAFYPIAKSNLLALAWLTLFLFWLRSRDELALTLPFFIAILLSVQVLVLDHHTGQFQLALIAAAWIALDTRPKPRSTPVWTTSALYAVTLVVIALQIGWSVHCIRAEVSHPYDPGLATAQFLMRDKAGKRIAGFAYESVSTQVWASHSLFINQPNAFWLWSAPVLINRRRTEALEQHPDVVVLGDYISREEFLYDQWSNFIKAGRHPFHKVLAFWQQNGYHETHRFCGDRFVRGGITNTFCEVVMEPNKPEEKP